MTSRLHHILKILNGKLAINFAWPNMIIIMYIDLREKECIVVSILLSLYTYQQELIIERESV